MLYATKREDLLGGVVDVLTGGRVKRVNISDHARTGVTEFDPHTGKVQRIVMPREENLPEGCTMTAARGLLDHESAHARYTEVDILNPTEGLLHLIENILEDPRVEALMMARFDGSIENITALSALGFSLQAKAFEKDMDPLSMALNGLSLIAYGHDPVPMIGGKPHASEVLAFLRQAKPYVEAALASKTTAGVTEASRAILALLKDASKHQPQPEPKPQPQKDGKPAPKDKGESGQDQDSAQAEEGQEPGSDEGEGEDERRDQPSRPSGKANDSEGEDETEASKASAEGISDREEAFEAENQDSEGSDGEPEDHDGVDGTTGESETPPTSALSEAADKAEASGHAPAIRTPAEAVLDAMRNAIEQEVRELEKAEAAELLKAQKSGLLCPIETNPKDWRLKELEIKAPVDESAEADYRRAVVDLKPVSMGIRHTLRNSLLAEGRTRIRTEREEGELNPRALYHVAQGTSTAVFRTVTKGKSKKVHVTLLVDCSGSMSGGKEIQARRAAIALNEALTGLPGITTEILGFTWGWVSGGTSGCIHFIAKTSRERDASGVTGLIAGGGNCDGSAVRWAARRALQVKTDRRVLIVLSDGAPTDGPRPEQDLRAAIDACERHHVETVGIGIMDRSVERFYPKNVVIHNANDLTGAVLQMLSSLLKPQSVAKGRGIARQSA